MPGLFSPESLYFFISMFEKLFSGPLLKGEATLFPNVWVTQWSVNSVYLLNMLFS